MSLTEESRNYASSELSSEVVNYHYDMVDTQNPGDMHCAVTETLLVLAEADWEETLPFQHKN